MSETYTKEPRAFRCRNCGYLSHAAHAGEREFPLACPVCKCGVVPAMSIGHLQKDRPQLFEGLTEADLRPVKDGGRTMPLPFNMVAFADHSNWEVLADAAPERLEELGLKPHHVCAHEPCEKGTEARSSIAHERVAEDGVASAETAVK